MHSCYLFFVCCIHELFCPLKLPTKIFSQYCFANWYEVSLQFSSQPIYHTPVHQQVMLMHALGRSDESVVPAKSEIYQKLIKDLGDLGPKDPNTKKFEMRKMN